MTLTFTDEELEPYFRMLKQAEIYLNNLIKMKRIEQYKEVQKRGDNLNITNLKTQDKTEVQK